MEDIQEIAKKIEKEGGKLYLVGGAIRNRLLNIKVLDEDYCVTGFTKEKFMQVFPQAKIQGKDFPVFILNNKEIALARKERKTGLGHRGFEFITDRSITIEEDLARRDLTINSIAEEVLTGKIIDPFNGKKDIEDRILRKTTKAFKEDPLRVYRVARFCATLSSKDHYFTIEQETLEAMNKLKSELISLSKERVFAEFKKSLASDKPSIFFEVLRKANVLDVHFKEIFNLIDKTQPEKYHPEGDSYVHTMIVVDNAAKLTNNLAIRFSCLTHDLGKGITPKQMLPHHYGHDENGVKLVQDLGKSICVPNSWTKCAKVACKWHMKAGIFEKMTPKKQVELIENVSKTMLGLEGLKIVVACDKNRNKEDLKATFNNIYFDKLGKDCIIKVNGNIIREKFPSLNGKALGEKLHEERVKWIKCFLKNEKLKKSL